MMDGPKKDDARPIVMEQKEEPAYCMTIEEDNENNGEDEWYSNILQYLKDGTYLKSADNNDQLTIQRLSTNYNICGERLYKRSYDGIHLLCVTAKEAQQIIEEIHESSYGPHINAHMLSRKIMRQGYYWTTMKPTMRLIFENAINAKSMEIWSTYHPCHYIPWHRSGHSLHGR